MHACVRIFTNSIVYGVDALSICNLKHSINNVLFSIKDDMVSAMRFGCFGFLGRRGCADDIGAESFGNL